MTGESKVKYLGIEEFKGKKDPSKTYYRVAFLQKTNVTKMFLRDGQLDLFNGIKPMEEMQIRFDINTEGKGTSVSLVSILDNK